MKKIDLIGQTFNRLTVIDEGKIPYLTDAAWVCICICGNITMVKATKLKSGHTKSCGCYANEVRAERITRWIRSPVGRKKNSDRLKSLRGPDAIHWKGGKEEENVRLRKSPEAKEWRQKVYERDGFLCTICKIPGKRLNAHHIKPWTHFPELRYELDNGQTVCTDCHKDLHKIHGNPKRKH